MKILIVGFGSVAKKHVAAIKRINPAAEIYALRSGSGASLNPGINNIFSLQELPAAPDFIIISNPTNAHKQTLKEVLNLNCPVFIEKPVFDNLKDTDELTGLINAKSIITYVACNLRFHPAIRFIKNWLNTEKPRVNEVNIYCGSYLPEWRPDTDFRNSYSAKSKMGGGVHLDLIHELDYCVWLFGLPQKVNVTRECLSSLEINSVDFANYQLIYPFFTAGITLNYYRRDPKREIEIVTDSDSIAADLLQNRIVSKLSGKILYEEPFEMSITYYEQMNFFINHIQQQKQPMNGIEEGLAVLKIALHE